MYLVENVKKITGFERFFKVVKGKKKRDLSILLEPNQGSPVCYFKKPKWIDEKEFEAIMSNLKISIDIENFKKDLEKLK